MATSDVQAFLDEKKNVEDDELAKQWSKLSLIYHKKCAMWNTHTLCIVLLITSNVACKLRSVVANNMYFS